MQRQVFVIHGARVFEKHEDYLHRLRTKEVTLEQLRFEGWKDKLSERLGENFDVFKLQMPNKENARYAEWKIWFERYIPFMHEGVILVGHSMGGMFLAKYLSENDFTHTIAAALLAAPPFDQDHHHHMADFVLPNTLDLFAKQAGKIFLYHSKDDEIVPYSNALEYQKALPSATLRSFSDRGHFNGETFPELEEDISSLN